MVAAFHYQMDRRSRGETVALTEELSWNNSDVPLEERPEAKLTTSCERMELLMSSCSGRAGECREVGWHEGEDLRTCLGLADSCLQKHEGSQACSHQEQTHQGTV